MTMLLRLRKWRLLRRVAGINIDAWDAFRAVTMPCLLVQGAISDVLTTDIVGRMKEVKPDLQLVVIPNRGHAPILDEPMARDAIVNFLDGLKKP
jgi:pimeloyl-ACP methyl ester carboxylesterase